MIGSRRKAVLSLSPDDKGLAYAVLADEGGVIVVRQAGHLRLETNPASDDPKLVGRELRSRLDENRIRERVCVLSVPVSLLLTQAIDLPDLDQDDLEDFADLQAEKHFSFAPGELALSLSPFTREDGGRAATLAGMSSKRLEAFRLVLAAAKLTLVGAMSGAGALVSARAQEQTPSAAIVLNATGIEFGVASGGGVSLLRRLAEIDEWHEDRLPGSISETVRSLRIALAQMPAGEGQAFHEVPLFGPAHLVEKFSGDLVAEAGKAGLRLVLRAETGIDSVRFASGVLAASVCPSALAVGVAFLRQVPCLQFVRQQKKRRRTAGSQAHTKVTVRVAAAAAVLLLAAVGAVLWQQMRLRSLRSEQTRLRPEADGTLEMKTWVKSHAPWFSTKAVTLDILRAVTDAFPERGDVWVTSLSVADSERVFISGRARSRDAWLSMQEQLRGSPAIQDLRVAQSRTGSRGREALTFSLRFDWRGGG